MWNTTNNNSSTVLNTPATGIIQKSNKDSFFLRMHQESQLAKTIFTDVPKYNDVKVTVLQVLLTHESWFLVEIVPTNKL